MTLPLVARLADLECRVRVAVAARRRTDPAPDDPFRGLYLADAAIEALFEAPRVPFLFPAATGAGPGRGAGPGAATDPAAGGPGYGLLPPPAGFTVLDTDLLLVALAPDVDSRFEQFYGYLNDDVTQRRATVGLALRLCGLPEASAAGRARLATGAPLVGAGLLDVTEPDRPLLSRPLRVPDRVVAHLLGDPAPDSVLVPALDTSLVPLPGLPGAGRLARVLRAGVRLVYLRDRPGGSGGCLAVTALHRLGLPYLAADARRLATNPDLVRALLREAVLAGAGVVLGPVDVVDSGAPGLFDAVEAVTAAGVPLLLHGASGWNPKWSRRPPLRMDAAPAPAPLREALWRQVLDGRLAGGVDPGVVTAHFTLTPPQIRGAAEAAVLIALAGDGSVNAAALRSGARAQNAAGLDRLARRIEPEVGWPDLVLPAAVSTLLRELAARARHRDRVLDRWRMRPGGGRGRGLTALFAGDSGTGKTMSAEVIAASLGLDLYTVNLATVVDKYVGETEKNLERIFAEAAGVNGVLLFDEADAIFGKRSEVRDAHDRYANIESAYLLQRMETFDGIAILATNLRANLDEAFTRRLDVVVDFPVPDEPLRRALWDRCLGTALPRAPDVDLDFLAAAFELAGGHIRSAAVTAAYLAAEAGRPVAMADLVGAVAREYRKLGRLCLEREFGPYLVLVG